MSENLFWKFWPNARIRRPAARIPFHKFSKTEIFEKGRLDEVSKKKKRNLKKGKEVQATGARFEKKERKGRKKEEKKIIKEK